MSMLWACPRGHYRPRPGDATSPPGTCPVCGESLVAFPEYSPPTERRPAGRPRETIVRPGPSPHPESPRPAPADTAILPLPDPGEETLTGTPPRSPGEASPPADTAGPPSLPEPGTDVEALDEALNETLGPPPSSPGGPETLGPTGPPTVVPEAGESAGFAVDETLGPPPSSPGGPETLGPTGPPTVVPESGESAGFAMPDPDLWGDDEALDETLGPPPPSPGGPETLGPTGPPTVVPESGESAVFAMPDPDLWGDDEEEAEEAGETPGTPPLDSVWDTLGPDAVPLAGTAPESAPEQLDETLGTPPGPPSSSPRPEPPPLVPSPLPPPPAEAPPPDAHEETLTADDRAPVSREPLAVPPPPAEEGGETLARPPGEAPPTPDHKTWATDRFNPVPAKPSTGAPDASPTRTAPAEGSGSFSWATGTGYEILGVLGRGGMGVVYKARQVALNRVVALKMILSGAHASPEDLARFKTEAEAVAALKHPNIVQVYDVGEREGRPYFSLEFIDGGSLQQRLDGTPLDPREAAELLMNVARGVQFAHQNRIIHRDLKPANVLLALKDPARPKSDKPPPLSECVPKITDFGLAKKLDDEALGHTGTEAILGTPTYMAPEQAEGRTREVGPAADIYALGAVFYDLLTGRPPFRGTTVMDTLMQVLSDEPVPPRRLQPGVPLDLQTICLKCLEKNPARRYPTAALLADDLERFLDGRPIAARPVGAVERTVKWARRRPALAGLVCLSVLLGVGLPIGGVAFAVHERNRADTEFGLRQAAVTARDAEHDAKVTAQEATRKEQQANEKLNTRNKELREAKEALEKQIGITKKSEQEAQDSFLDAQTAVNKLILVSQKHLRNAPGMETVREGLINEAVKLCQRFVERKGNSPEVQLQAARAHRLMGDLNELLGKAGEADRHYQQAAALFEKLISNPDHPPAEWKGDYHKELSDVYQGRWVVLEESNPRAAEAALKKALTEVVEKSAERPSWAAGRRKAEAAIHNNLGILYYRRKDPAGAQEQAREAEKLFGELHADFPSRDDYTLEWARAKVNLAALLIKDQPKEAKDLLEKAIGLLKPLVEEYKRDPADARELGPAYAKELGSAYANLGVLEGNQEPGGGEARYREALKMFEGLESRFPHVPDYRYLHAVSQVNLGRSLIGIPRRGADSEKALEQGCAALELLVRDFPENALYRKELAVACAGLGAARSRAGDLAGARKPLERALELSRGLVKEKPSDEEYRKQLADDFRNLIALLDQHARDLAGQQRWAEAEKEVRQLVELRRDPSRRDLVPDSATERAELASTWLALADALLHQGKHAEAAGLVREKISPLAPQGWEKLPRVAGVLARCVGEVFADTAMPIEERRPQARKLAEKALELLRQAADAGLPDKEYVRTSEDFRALRTDSDFGPRFTQILEGWKAGD